MEQNQNAHAYEIPLSFKKFPPDTAYLSGLGFDILSSSKSSVRLRRNHTTSLLGQPALFTEITVRRDAAFLTYGLPQGADHATRQLVAATLLFRVLSLLPGASAGAAQLSQVALPALESASRPQFASSGEAAKRLSEASAQLQALSSKNAQLSRKAEEAECRAMELERQVAALSERARRLEAVSDASLADMIIDWVLAHNGSFSAAQFARANSIPAARAEEGMDALLRSGAIRKVGAKHAVPSQHQDKYEKPDGFSRLASTGEAAKKIAGSFFGKK